MDHNLTTTANDVKMAAIGVDPRFLKKGGGSILGLQGKKGGFMRGSNFGPNVKKPT